MTTKIVIPIPISQLPLLALSIICGFPLFVASGGAQEQQPLRFDKEREEIYEHSHSPDGKWSITMPLISPKMNWDARHSIVSNETGEVLVVIDGVATSDKSNHGSLRAMWSKDSQRLLWIVDSKWNQLSVNYLTIRDGNVSQFNVYRSAVFEILARLRQDKPDEFAEAVAETAGNGTAYPMGFTIRLDIDPSEMRPELPLKFTVELTSNPKGITTDPTLEATLEGSLNDKQALVWKNYSASYTAAKLF